MKKTFFMIAAAAVLVCSVSCKKETEKNDLSGRPVRLTATTENYGAEKTNLSGYALKWQDGDQISVMCEDFTTPGIYQVQEGGKASAGFVYAGTGDEPTLTTPLRAGYPASSWDADVANITLPSHQNYVANSMEEFPMYGETETHSVNFKNLCGVVRMRLVKPGESVTKIVITANNYLNGVYSVDYNDGQPTLQHVGTTGTNGITLECAEPVSIENSTDFYIYLPAGTYGKLRIEVYNNIGLLCEINAKNAITIQRNKITTIAPSAAKLKFNYVAGLISVSANKQVRFASGNLQYVRATGEFQLASSQYEVFGKAYATSSTTNPVVNTDPIVDLFYLSQGASNNYGACVLSTEFTSSNFADWCGALSDNSAEWRTLTADEWNYALSSSVDIRKHNWGYAVITDEATNTVIRGLVLVPDNWTAPTGFNFTYWGSTNNMTTSDWTDRKVNHYTTEQWKTLELAGAVFLPGYLPNERYNGYYWTSSVDPSSSDLWQYLNVRNHGMTGAGFDYGGVRAIAVRFAQDYEPLVIEVNE